jgi:hypothetical protein
MTARLRQHPLLAVPVYVTPSWPLTWAWPGQRHELGRCTVCRHRVWQAPDGGERLARGGHHFHRRGWSVIADDEGPPSDRP